MSSASGEAVASPGLVKAIWAVVVALATAAAAIFWAGYNWSEINRKLNKIDEFDQKFSYLQTLKRYDDKGTSGKFGYNTPALHCSPGYVVVGVQLGGENLTIFCGQLVK
jgi:hypothetical protein